MSDNYFLMPIQKSPEVVLELPGSKSIANRVLLLAAIASGKSIIHNVPIIAEDVLLMIAALKELGIELKPLNNDNTSYEIIGCNGNFPNKSVSIFCGNSGTIIRFLSAVLALQKGVHCLTGNLRMKQRPISDLVNSLSQIGGDVTYIENKGFPPIQINIFSDNQASLVSVSGKTSSQYLTGLLIALTQLNRKINIVVEDELISKPYIDITLGLLAKFGYNVINKHNSYLMPKSSLSAIEYTIEPDASSASYFLAIGALAGNVTINKLTLSSLQGDRKFAQILADMGAQVTYTKDSIQVKKGILNSLTIDMNDMPDVAMTIAVLAIFAKGNTIITGISSWKVKETDRLKAMQNELTKLGAIVSITEDSIAIIPPLSINSNVEIETYDDHRMVMAFSLVAAGGIGIIIKNYKCVAKTFANYFEIFNKVCYKL